MSTVKKLREIAKIGAGQGAPQGKDNYCLDGIPFIKAGNLVELLNGKKECDVQNVSENVAKSHKLKLYPAGTVLFAKSGMSCTKGYVYVLKSDCYVVSHLACITPVNTSGNYLKYYFEYNKPNLLIKDEAYPSISLSDIGNLDIRIESPEREKYIVDCLDKIGRLIENQKIQIQKMDALVKSQFIEMFGDLDINHMGWEVKRFDQVAKIDTKATTDFEKYADYPHIGIDSIEKDTGRLTGYRTVKDDNVKSCKYIFGPDHIIYSKIRPVLNKVAMPDFEGLCSSDAFPILVNKDACDKIYWAYVMRSEYFLRYVISLSKGAQIPRIDRTQLNQFQVPLPPLEKQKQFADIVVQSDKSKFIMKQRLEALGKCYNASLQEYFG